ncbi:TetR/AcrR family transcriptional regulator [Actinocorallia libanotica]|uniref:HTH tetR-type domain-containing protein n=1 Tax=Actinocorallia libanotica TaxID=46162 RepID=A0ABN1S1X6_9ACTN
MPKVSPEHLEQRRQQIIEAALRCFAAKGFAGTSMQDIFKESGLSAGAVYRYFPAKADLVSEIAKRKREAVQSALREALEREELPPLPEVLHDFLTAFLAELGENGKLRVLPEVWAAALHDDAIGVIVDEVLTGVRGVWAELAVRYQRAGRLSEGADPAAIGAVLTCLIPGFVIQRLVLGDMDPEFVRRGLEGVLGFS